MLTSAAGPGENRLDAISAGLRAVRIVDAARRWQSGTQLTRMDITAISSTADDLENEIRILRNQATPDVDSETSFAFASLALEALTTPAHAGDAESATEQLEALVSDLRLMLSGAAPDKTASMRIEAIFLRASDLVQTRSGLTGETFEQEEHMLNGHFCL